MKPHRLLSDALLDAPLRHYLDRQFNQVPATERALRIEETLRFLFIAHECRGPIPVAREIDEVWHALILQTQEYVALCGRLPTGRYIHHSSNEYLRWFDPSVGGPNELANDVRMLALYVANFGPLGEASSAHWLLARHLTQRRGWSMEALNDWLQSGAAAEVPPSTFTHHCDSPSMNNRGHTQCR